MIGEIIGQEISVNVPKNMKAQVIPQGNSKQNTREGYNLANYNTSSSVSNFEIGDIENGKNYTLSFNIKGTSGYNLRTKVDGSMVTNIATKHAQTGNQLITFTATEDAILYINGFEGSSGFEFNQIMLLEGTYTLDNLPPFEEYGAMPSLDYPSEVEAVGDNINLYPYSDVEFKSDATQEQWCYLDGQLGAYGNTVTDKTDYKITLEKGKYYFKLETADSNIITGGLVANGESSEKQLTVFDNAFEITETTVCTLRLKVANPSLGINIKSIKLEKGTTATAYSPYGQGNIEIIHNNKNELILNDNNSQSDGLNFSIKDGVITISGTATSTYQGLYIPVKRTFNEDYVLSTNAVGSKAGLHIKAAYKLENGNLQYPDIFTRFVFPTNSYLEQLYVIVDSGSTIDATIKLQLEKGTEATEFVENKGNTYTIPVQREMLANDYIDYTNKKEIHTWKKVVRTSTDNLTVAKNDDNEIFQFQFKDKVENGNQYSNVICNMFKFWDKTWNNTGCFVTYNGEFWIIIKYGDMGFSSDLTVEEAKQKFLGYLEENNLIFYYEMKNAEQEKLTEELDLTGEQTQVLEQLSNLYLYEGINYLYSTDDPSPIFQFSYDKIVNDFKFYLSENGRLIFPKENISFLCSISESSIPSMPEALETSATIAGRDGDVPLSTTYGPMSFELVLYTEDNLTPEEKLKQEIFLNRFCNSIKNNTETFALELAQKFYKIKYNGLLNKENYPKFLKFTLPFKSSKSFAYDVKKHIIYGNSTVESNTIEPTGFECVIKGPAIKPIISLNDYSIEYNNTILDDESLIIDTNNSTAVLVNSEGTRVNAMRYYNHQFPKILNGENELKILSGIDNPENVSISWYDLTL